jgi:mannose-6-phosphate isomerase-like protein (cupin superfamily)
VERKVKIVKLKEAVPNVEPKKRNKSILFSKDISAETEVVYQRFAPNHMGQYHVHHHAENIWIVMKGTLEAIIGGVRYFVKEGEVIFMPATVPHATGNPSSDTDMLAVEIYAPPTGRFNPADSFPAELPATIKEAEPATA